jgi:hypothetical protein
VRERGKPFIAAGPVGGLTTPGTDNGGVPFEKVGFKDALGRTVGAGELVCRGTGGVLVASVVPADFAFATWGKLELYGKLPERNSVLSGQTGQDSQAASQVWTSAAKSVAEYSSVADESAQTRALQRGTQKPTRRTRIVVAVELPYSPSSWSYENRAGLRYYARRNSGDGSQGDAADDFFFLLPGIAQDDEINRTAAKMRRTTGCVGRQRGLLRRGVAVGKRVTS